MKKGLLIAFLFFSYFLPAQQTGTTTGTQSVPGAGGSSFNGGAAGTAFQDITEIAAPANPAAGVERLYSDSTTHFLTCLRSSGVSCFSSGGAPAFNTVTAGTNLNALVEGSGGSLIPSGTGQIYSVGNWFPGAAGIIYPVVPTVSVSNTGGSLIQGNAFIRITYVGLATTVPSPELRQSLAAGNCPSSATCQITVNMPTTCQAGSLPAGVTGCTVWDSTTSNTEKQQAAANACVNITTATCVINTLAAGSTLTAPATSGLTPSLTALAQPDFIVPTVFMQIADGTYQPVAGIDTSALNILSNNSATGFTLPATGGLPGTFTWTHRFFFNDTNSPPIISNSQVSIHHLACQTTGCLTAPGSGVDDRAFSIEMVDASAPGHNVEQSLSQYNERIVTDTAITCAPVSAGVPWGESCFAAGRFVSADTRASNSGTSFLSGVAGVASTGSATAQTSGFANGTVVGVTGGAFESNNNANGNAGQYVGGQFGVNGASGNTNGAGYAVEAVPPTTRFATRNVGYHAGQWSSTLADWDFFGASDGSTTGKNFFQGAVWLGNGIVAGQSTIAVTGSLNSSAYATTQLATPTGLSVAPFGTTGAITVIYKYTCADVNGGETTGSASAQTVTANADLTAVHGNTISTPAVQSIGCSSYNIYRTSSGGATCNGGACTNGKLGNLVAPLANIAGGTGTSFSDTGQAGDGNTAVAQPNTTGGIKPFSYQTNTNCSSAASPAVCGSAAAGSVAVPTGTNATLQVNTTAVTANSQIFVQSDDTLGTKLSITCNTTLASLIVEPVVSARAAQASFTITISGTTTVNPVCLSYFIVN